MRITDIYTNHSKMIYAVLFDIIFITLLAIRNRHTFFYSFIIHYYVKICCTATLFLLFSNSTILHYHMKMYYTHPFAYNTPVPEAFTTIRKCAVLQPNVHFVVALATFTTIRKCAVLQPQMALQTTNRF